MRPSLGLLAVFAVVAVVASACGTDGLVSDPELDPPAGTEAYDPSDGQGEGGGGYYTTTGQVTAGDGPTGANDASAGDASSGEGSSGAPADCTEAERLCGYTFELGDAGFASVDVMGSFAPDGWDNGAAMTLEDTTWRVTLDLAWADDTEYRFRIDGSADWIFDPMNRDTENDNSVVRAPMCASFTCP